MWYEILYRVLSIINYVVLLAIAIPLSLQVFYVLFSWVRKKTYPKSDKKGRIAFVIPGHNEEDVIYDTVHSLMTELNYPKDMYDVFVVAHNCTDKTAELAEKAGANVLVLNDPDPSRRMALYPLKYGINYIINEAEKEYDLVIHLDADNHVNPEFASLMNDAYQSGVDFARPYEGAKNATQNFFTKACTMFYAFDSRFGSRLRERLHIGAHVNGGGATMSVRMLKATGGYDCVSMSDDAEYCFNRLLDGYKGHFVEDAVVYEDMPSSLKDTYNRNKRIGSGSVALLKSKLIKMFGKFFTTGNFSYMEVCLTYSFVFLTVVLATWLPLFYIYNFIFLAFAAYGQIPLSLYTAEHYYNILWGTVIILGSILVGLFVLFGFVQAAILVITDYKKLGAKKRRELITAVLFFPAFLILYSITICIGTMSKPTWGKAKRSPDKKDTTTEQ